LNHTRGDAINPKSPSRADANPLISLPLCRTQRTCQALLRALGLSRLTQSCRAGEKANIAARKCSAKISTMRSLLWRQRGVIITGRVDAVMLHSPAIFATVALRALGATQQAQTTAKYCIDCPGLRTGAQGEIRS
jgi:hypothetical protein